MPQVHLTGASYTAPSPTSGYEWLPYANRHYREIVQNAIKWLDENVKKHLPCQTVFKALPGGRSFKDVWTDSTIWISYCSVSTVGSYGATISQKHITICQYALLKGLKVTAATIVHELAHCNGAGASDNKAEATLKGCLLKKQFDPAIIGELDLQRESRPTILT